MSGTIKSSGFSYGDYHIDSGDANIAYYNSTLDIRDATLYVGRGSVKAKGQYNFDSGDFSVDSTIHDAEIASFTQNLSYPVSGVMNGRVLVNGKNSIITVIEGDVRGSISFPVVLQWTQHRLRSVSPAITLMWLLLVIWEW